MMDLHLIENARNVFKHAWSIRLAVLSAVFSALELAVPFLNGLFPPKLMAALAFFTALGAAAMRLIYQPKLPECDNVRPKE